MERTDRRKQKVPRIPIILRPDVLSNTSFSFSGLSVKRKHFFNLSIDWKKNLFSPVDQVFNTLSHDIG